MTNFKTILFAVLAVILSSCCKSGDYEFERLYENLPFEMERVYRPQIPDYSVNLTDFGAVGDGVTLNSEAFAKAMSHLESKGGGHLIVPAGIWLTGPITILSNIDLHVERHHPLRSEQGTLPCDRDGLRGS